METVGAARASVDMPAMDGNDIYRPHPDVFPRQPYGDVYAVLNTADNGDSVPTRRRYCSRGKHHHQLPLHVIVIGFAANTGDAGVAVPPPP